MPIQLNEEDGGRLLNVHVSGKLTSADYEHFVPEFERLVGEHGKLRVLFDMTDFHGWDVGALWEDTKFAIRERGSGDGDQGAGRRDQGSGAGIRDQGQGSGIRDQGSGDGDQGSGIRDQGSGIRDQGTGIRDQGSGIRERGAGAGSRERKRLLIKLSRGRTLGRRLAQPIACKADARQNECTRFLLSHRPGHEDTRILASTIFAPSPAGRAMTGFKSSSITSLNSTINRETRKSTSSMARISSGGWPR